MMKKFEFLLGTGPWNIKFPRAGSVKQQQVLGQEISKECLITNM
jgi:hypothetical protein